MGVYVADKGGITVVVCPRCETPRTVSARGERVCDERDMLLTYWLQRFSNEDLLVLARHLFNRRRSGSIETIQGHRERLLGAREP